MKLLITPLLSCILVVGGSACTQDDLSDNSGQAGSGLARDEQAGLVSTMEAEEFEDGPVYAYRSAADLMAVFGPWEGDLTEMVQRRMIRALVPWSDTYYYLDGINQRGVAYEAMNIFEKWLNRELGSGTTGIHVVILPVRRDLLLPYIAEGRGDIALGGITATDERRRLVDFSDPTSREIHEWLVQSQAAERVDSLDDLSGREIYVPASSSYWESLQAINADFARRGLEPIDLKAADEYLSTEDLLHMVNAAAIPYTVADHVIAGYWANVLPDLRIREDIEVRSGARYAWAIRHNSPELKALLNRFVADHRQGTLLGNVVINRYFKDTDRLQSVSGEQAKRRFQQVFQHFRAYSDQYGFDAMMMVAQGFQESRLDQSKRSQRGAIGIMQLLPSTAADPAVDVPDITTAENNILAGIRYMAWIRDTYFNDPEMDEFNQTAMAFASYNAGPNRVERLRSKAQARGLDPDVWFDNVELIAAEDIGRETVEYVANIYKYFVSFKLAQQRHPDLRTDAGP